jgi:ATP-dependent Lhr-like helicase
MEDAGRIRRGYFVGGLAATQFAVPAAVDLLRSVRDEPDQPQTVYLAASDPANPYGAILKWPQARGEQAARDKRGPTRSAGAGVILVNGELAAYVGRADRQFLSYLPEDEPGRSAVAREVAAALFRLATADRDRGGMLIGEIGGTDTGAHPLAPFLLEAGFVSRATGFQASPPRE